VDGDLKESIVLSNDGTGIITLAMTLDGTIGGQTFASRAISISFPGSLPPS
jgi:hypothetical protein